MGLLPNNIYDITKEYTDMYKVIIYKSSFDLNALGRKNRDLKEVNKIKKETKIDASIQRSVRRSRSMINDYVHCNDFDLFVTFTFSPKKVNRYDLSAIYPKMQSWLWRQHQKYPNMRYVVVPERHKDGALHFHALIGGYTGKLNRTSVIQHSKRVHNIPSFRFGFTNATYLDDDRQKSIAYMCKYITKDMALISNRRRYWASKNLIKPETFYNKLYDMGIDKFINHSTVQYETDFNVVHHVPKDLFV